MNGVKLDTAEFDFLESNILRVRVHAGVEVDEAIAKEYCDTIKRLTSGPAGILVDKINEYSLTFAAQTEFLSKPPNTVATAILIHRPTTAYSAKTQLPILRTETHPVEIFRSEAEAVKWLKSLLP